MQATTVELLGLFERDIRYLIPIFQRNYKWTKDSHWAPLWADVVAVAEDILDFGESPELADHFLGAIVCEQLATYGLDAHTVSVIDGQQRLTTLQLVLAGIYQVAARRQLEEGEFLRPLLENRSAVVRNRPDQRYKVWPNVADRLGYAAAMEGSSGPSNPEQAVRFFSQAASAWLDAGDPDDPLDDADNTPQERMTALVTALTRHVKLVKIDLEANDSAQVIFETLNARGEPLTDADLIRNHLFRVADAEGQSSEELHARYWMPFDDERWSAQIAHGRHQRDRLQLFLNYWLSMRKAKQVPANAIFREFKDYLTRIKLPAADVAEDIARFARVFDSFDQQVPDTREWWFFRRLAEMDLITVHPVLLWLFAQSDEELPRDRRRTILLAIESFLARRLLRRDSTRSYGDIFTTVLQAALGGAPADADRRVVEVLASKTSESDRWPNDDDMRSAIMTTNVYRLKQSRLKMILEAIERDMVDAAWTEKVDLGASLWIEHLLPQTWRGVAAWELPAGLEDRTQASFERDHLLHTLGNLTLTTAALDVSLSNRPWPEKVASLQAHSSLALNREILTTFATGWDDATVRQRSLLLADRVIGIWPGPEAMLRATDRIPDAVKTAAAPSV